MITRKAILVSNPGEKGSNNYCGEVVLDMENYEQFLKSPFGGTWYDDEIIQLTRPTRSELTWTLRNAAQHDYTLIVFSGHGWYSKTHSSTILELRTKEDIDSMDLRMGCGKRTVILDCGRRRSEGITPPIEEREESPINYPPPDPTKCRRYYDEWIEKCSLGLIVTHACKAQEIAGDQRLNGGYYSYNLIRAAKEWAQYKMRSHTVF